VDSGAGDAVASGQLAEAVAAPQRTDDTIVGARLWPSYTLKSLGLFLLLFGAVTGLGGLV